MVSSRLSFVARNMLRRHRRLVLTIASVSVLRNDELTLDRTPQLSRAGLVRRRAGRFDRDVRLSARPAGRARHYSGRIRQASPESTSGHERDVRFLSDGPTIAATANAFHSPWPSPSHTRTGRPSLQAEHRTLEMTKRGRSFETAGNTATWFVRESATFGLRPRRRRPHVSKRSPVPASPHGLETQTPSA